MRAGSRNNAIPQMRRERVAKTRWERMQKTDLTLAQLVELLNTSKLSEGKTYKTTIWYEQGIMAFGQWLEEQGLPATLEHFTLDLVRSYVVGLHQRLAQNPMGSTMAVERKLSDHTINSYARSLRAFSNWLFSEQYTTKPLLARLKMPKMTQKVQDILQPDEIAQIIASLNPRTELGARDQAIFLLLLDTGMRAGELCGLRLGDLHLDQGYAKVFGKGKKERPVKIGSRAAKALRFYILHWRKPAMPHIDMVFLTARGVIREAQAIAPEPGEALTVNALSHIMKRIGVAASVPRMHAHLLRHTFACMYLMRHRDPFALKSLLGHTTLAMTNHYCEAVQQMDVVRADAVSIIDGMDLRALDVNRRGRPTKNVKRRA